MSASRTLLRKLKVVRDRMAQPENRPAKKGSLGRRIILTEDVGRYEHTFHATKGHRWVRRPA